MKFSEIRHFLVISLLFLLLCPSLSTATHLRGGEITVRPLQCGTMGYEITLTLYTNTATTATPGGGILTFGDGTQVVLPDILSTVIDAQFSIGRAVFIVTHQYPGIGTYLIGYSEGNRNAGVLNFQNSVNSAFFIESQLVINPSHPCNNPIRFTIPPIDKACSGMAFSHNPGAKDDDGDSISFVLVTPKRTSTQAVQSYQAPNAPAFYTGFNYQHANEEKTLPPSFLMDAITGNLVWDAPGSVGQYGIAIKVTEWKKVNGIWITFGFVIRDIQIIVEDCPNRRPSLEVPVDVCVAAGEQLTEIIRGFDEDFDPVKIEVFTSDNFQSSAPVVLYNEMTQSTKAPHDTAHVKFTWNISCNLVRDQPYIIVFKITDVPPNGIRLSTFKTWKITVVGPAPKFQDMTLDLAQKNLTISWHSYMCPNAPVMEVWRRVDGAQKSVEACGRGLTRAMGFEKIASVTGSQQYVDKDINPGAMYCYRLVAIFETPFHAISRPSAETCVGPIKVAAPVITKVSVKKTDLKLGQVQLQWTSPYQINTSQFPGPYEYEVYRTNDGVSFVKASNQRITDTTYVDPDLNTTAVDYGYRIVLYSPGGLTHENPVDTSALAFFPRLAKQSAQASIHLSWNAKVPWSNQSLKYPYHYIFRSEAGTFVLIDSVDVNTFVIDQGFEFVDEGVYNNQPLKPNTVYRYKIRTKGTYGNARLDPITNDSNEVEAQITDILPPCQATVSIEITNCENFIKTTSCEISNFKNQLTWEYPDDCGNDVIGYTIYFKSPGKEYVELATTQDLSYTHNLENSFAGCYKIVAVDRSDNEGPESEPVCNENCGNFFIPNVFTPANGDGANDVFPGIAGAVLNDPGKCPRFVTYLDIKIFNRWGKEVFSINAPFEEDMLQWKGLDDNGNECPAGIYFYEGNIGFNAIDATQQKKKLRGWVNLIR